MNGEEEESRAYALKLVIKGTQQQDVERESRLRSEFAVYLKLQETQQQSGMTEIAPRCYGLFESRRMMILALDYGGETLEGEWSSLTEDEK